MLINFFHQKSYFLQQNSNFIIKGNFNPINKENAINFIAISQPKNSAIYKLPAPEIIIPNLYPKTEKEEPKLPAVNESLPEDEKMGMYQELGSKRVMKMISKANEKNPDGPIISEEQWAHIPTTLRYSISNKILGAEELAQANFQN